MVNPYLAATLTHDSSKAPFAKNLKFAENSVRLPPPEGIGFTSTGLGEYKFYICNPQADRVHVYDFFAFCKEVFLPFYNKKSGCESKSEFWYN